MAYPTSVKTFPTRANGQTITPAMFNDPDDEITGIEQGLLEGCAHWLLAQGLRTTDADALTITSGAITVASGYVTVDTEASASTDSLDTITPGSPTNGVAIGEGALLVVSPASASRVVTVTEAGNIQLFGGAYVMNSAKARLLLMFDGTNWVEVSRANGFGWTTPTFSAADYTGNGSMTWTVDAGDVTTLAYQLRGTTMTVLVSLSDTTVGGTPNDALQIAIPAGKTAAKVAATPMYAVDNSTEQIGRMVVSAAGTKILLLKVPSANWTAGAVAIQGQITFEVQ